MTKAEQDTLRKQQDELSEDTFVTCTCGDVNDITAVYKCLYCGIWFCRTCAEKHFGGTKKEWNNHKNNNNTN